MNAVLDAATSDQQETEHSALISQQEMVDARAEKQDTGVTRQNTVKDKKYEWNEVIRFNASKAELCANCFYKERLQYFPFCSKISSKFFFQKQRS